MNAENQYYERENLHQQLRELESTIARVKKESKANEQMLQHLLKEEMRKSTKLNSDLAVFKCEQANAESKLKHSKHKQHYANSFIQSQRASANDFRKIAATDRKWLESEMTRRSSISLSKRQDSQSRLSQMGRRITSGW